MKTAGLEKLELTHGSHDTREEGMCAMEAVAWLAGEPHSDAPRCACPVLRQYLIGLNDWLDATERQLLKPYLPRIIGTRDGRSLERAKILAHRAGTVFAPIAAEIAGRKDLADEMRAVPFGDWTTQEEVCLAASSELRSNAAYAAAYAAYAAAYAADGVTYAATAATAAADGVTYAAGVTPAGARAVDAASHAAAGRRPKIIHEALAALEAVLEVV